MSKNNKTWQSEVIETEDWNKLIKKENALIVADVYCEAFGHCEAFTPSIQNVMRKLEDQQNQIYWRRINVSKLREESKSSRGGSDYIPEDTPKMLEDYIDHADPTPHILFIKNQKIIAKINDVDMITFEKTVEKMMEKINDDTSDETQTQQDQQQASEIDTVTQKIETEDASINLRNDIKSDDEELNEEELANLVLANAPKVVKHATTRNSFVSENMELPIKNDDNNDIQSENENNDNENQNQNMENKMMNEHTEITQQLTNEG